MAPRRMLVTPLHLFLFIKEQVGHFSSAECLSRLLLYIDHSGRFFLTKIAWEFKWKFPLDKVLGHLKKGKLLWSGKCSSKRLWMHFYRGTFDFPKEKVKISYFFKQCSSSVLLHSHFLLKLLMVYMQYKFLLFKFPKKYTLAMSQICLSFVCIESFHSCLHMLREMKPTWVKAIFYFKGKRKKRGFQHTEIEFTQEANISWKYGGGGFLSRSPFFYDPHGILDTYWGI